jgi:hypothetical protein
VKGVLLVQVNGPLTSRLAIYVARLSAASHILSSPADLFIFLVQTIFFLKEKRERRENKLG